MEHVWQAKWIWHKETREVNSHILVRKDFELEAAAGGAPGAARMLIGAESFAVAWINGVKVHFTTSLSYPEQHYYEEADVSSALRPGTNQIAVLVRYLGISSGSSVPKDPGVVCELHIGREGKDDLVVATDEAWKVLLLDAWLGRQRRSHWHNLDLVEIMDYRRLPAGWPMVRDLSAFEPPLCERVPGVRLGKVEPRPFPKAVLSDYGGMTVLKTGLVEDQIAKFDIPALAVSAEDIEESDLGIAGATAALCAAVVPECTAAKGAAVAPAPSPRTGETPVLPGEFTIQPPGEGKAATILLGLGKYMAGYPTLVAEGNPGATIDIAYHEKLEGGRIRAEKPGMYTADRYILGNGPAEIVTDEWKGLRFLQLTFRNVRAPLRVRGLRLIESAYPAGQKAYFTSSEKRLERIFEISLNAARLCMQDNIMDCPWREKRQWIGDVHRISLLAHHAFRDVRIVRGVLRQHAHYQDTSGRIWVCLPLLEEYPCQTMEWLRAVVEYDEYTGDKTLIDELADNIEMLHRWFLRCRDERGLFFNPNRPIINWMDHPYGPIVKYQYQTAFLMMNLRYLLFLDDAAFVLRRAGHTVEARKALAERKKIAGLIPECFLDSASGLLRDCADASLPVTFSEMAHALAVLAKVPAETGKAVELWDRFEAYAAANPGGVTLPSPYGKWQTLEALGRMGRRDQVIEHILRCWGPMADSGTDTAWEGFEGGASECHGWSGTPVVALIRHVLKMDPRKGGKKRVRNVGGVKWMECEIRE